MKRKAFLAAVLSFSMLVAGCSEAADEGPAAVAVSEMSGDPIPVFEEAQDVDERGATIENDGVLVEIPKGAIRGEATVAVAPALGEGDPELSSEVWGAPVQVEHAQPLAAPVTVEWDIAELTEEQRQIIGLARWNAEFEVWELLDTEALIEGDTLTAELTEFSIITWISQKVNSFNQVVGEFVGTRAAAPECAEGTLPDWVKNYVRPDEDITGTPMLTCVEPDDDDAFTLRIVNNRSHAQRITLTPESEKWAWGPESEMDYGAAGSVWRAVSVFDTGNSVMMAPTSEIAVGIGRPEQSGSVNIKVTSQSDALSVFGDLLTMVVDNFAPGGFDTPVANAFVQGLYECGGKQLLESRPNSPSEHVSAAIDAMHSCAQGVTAGGDLAYVVRGGFENVLRSEIEKGGQNASRAIKTNRLVHQISERLVYVDIAYMAEYMANQFADSILGTTSFSAWLYSEGAAIGAVKLTVDSVGGVSLGGSVEEVRSQLVALFGREPDVDLTKDDACWEMVGGESGHTRRILEWGGFTILASDSEYGVKEISGWSLVEGEWPAEFSVNPGFYFGRDIFEVEALTGGTFVPTFNSVYREDGVSWYADYETNKVNQVSTMPGCE